MPRNARFSVIYAELISGEYTPTLCQVIPAYEELLQSLWELHLEKIKQDKLQIACAIAASIKKIKDYISKAQHLYDGIGYVCQLTSLCSVNNQNCISKSYIWHASFCGWKLIGPKRMWQMQRNGPYKWWNHVFFVQKLILTSRICLQILDHLISHHHTTTISPQAHFINNLNQQPSLATPSRNAGQAVHWGMSKLCALRQATITCRTGSVSMFLSLVLLSMVPKWFQMLCCRKLYWCRCTITGMPRVTGSDHSW